MKLPQEARERIGRGEGKQLIAGIRPENFEDASLVGDAKEHGTVFTAHIELVESLGSELYVHFTVESDQSIESDELRELAEDAGGGEVPMAGEEGRIVARLDPASRGQAGAGGGAVGGRDAGAPVRPGRRAVADDGCVGAGGGGRWERRGVRVRGPADGIRRRRARSRARRGSPPSLFYSPGSKVREEDVGLR